MVHVRKRTVFHPLKNQELRWRERVDQLVGEGFLVALAALGDWHEGFAGLGIAEGDERGETVVERLAVGLSHVARDMADFLAMVPPPE